MHALVGKDQEWKAFLEGHPQNDRYEKSKKNRGRKTLFNHLTTKRWRGADMVGARGKVLRALLDSELYRERDLNYIHDFYGLIDSGLFSPMEVVSGVASLPKDHPLKAEAMFHVASLKTYKIKGKGMEKGIAAYTEALKLAREKGEAKLANQILAHRCDVVFRDGRKNRAKADAALIVVDDLPLRDQKWVKTALAKWRK